MNRNDEKLTLMSDVFGGDDQGNQIYRWRTDAYSGELRAKNCADALAQLISKDKWDKLDSAREKRFIADGAWLLIWGDAEGDLVLERGVAP